MGSIVKSGSVPISGVLAPGEKLKQKGLIYAATPASDFICGTLQLAAGMNLHVFTTGRGTPYGLAAVPVIKVATRSDLARRWHDLMDVNAGTIADGSASIEDVGWELFRLMLDVASGRKKTWAEQWKLHNALVLFNPAPVFFAGPGFRLFAQRDTEAGPRRHQHPSVLDLEALVEQWFEPVEVLDPRLARISGSQMHVQLHREMRREHQTGVLGERGDFRNGVMPPTRGASGIR